MPLSQMAFGDANGIGYTPVTAATALVHEVVRVQVDSAVRDPDNANQLLVTATLPAGVGGFTIREVGVYTDAGDLALIGPAEIYKSVAGDGIVTDLILTVAVSVSPAAQVEVFFDQGAGVTRDFVLQHRQFFAVKSATVPAPPGSPATEDQYLVPDGATGAWAGHGRQIALWRGATEGWLFISPAAGSEASAADTRVMWVLTTTGEWVQGGGGFGAEATKASAATCDLGTASTHLVRITGSTAIASFGASADVNAPVYLARFTAALTLQNSAGLALPGGANIVTAAGDALCALYLGGGAWRVVLFQPAAGYDRKGDAAAAQAAAVITAKDYADALAALLAPKINADLQGSPQATTAPVGTNSTRIATTAYVRNEFAAFIGMAPAALDTWGELVAAIQAEDGALGALTATVATKAPQAALDATNAAVAGKVNRSGDTMTGPLGVPAFVVDGGSGEADVYLKSQGKNRGYLYGLPDAIGLAVCDEAGNYLSTALAADRSTGAVRLPTALERTANDSRAARADWVKSLGGKFRSYYEYAASVSLSEPHLGALVWMTGGGTVTLPDPLPLQAGEAVTIYAWGADVVVAVPAGRYLTTRGTTPGSLVLRNGQTAQFVAGGSGYDPYWRAAIDPGVSLGALREIANDAVGGGSVSWERTWAAGLYSEVGLSILGSAASSGGVTFGADLSVLSPQGWSSPRPLSTLPYDTNPRQLRVDLLFRAVNPDRSLGSVVAEHGYMSDPQTEVGLSAASGSGGAAGVGSTILKHLGGLAGFRITNGAATNITPGSYRLSAR